MRKFTAQPAIRAQVAPFHVMKVVSAAAERQRVLGDVVSLAAGQPSSPAPAPVLAAAMDALKERPLGYTEQLGLTDLRAAIARHYRPMYGLEVSRENVVVTTGASSALTLAILAGFDVGDRVAIVRPGYPAYRNILSALGCEVVDLVCDAASAFRPTVAMLDALETPIKGLIVASPANPTGSVLSRDELSQLAYWCAINDVLLISDEIYHGISFGEPPHSAWEFHTESVVINSFSKFWCMTGWRLGWMLAPAGLLSAVDTLTGNMSLCPPALAQYAALHAFTDAAHTELQSHVEVYRRNRDILLNRLPQLGIDRLAQADGAFYVYADISHLGEQSDLWCRRLLDETGVAAVPGIDFDPWDGKRFVRFSYGGRTEEIEEALNRLAAWLPKKRSQ
ncbi:aminotransferase class I/II-fold pyridoxal phosphate-dependent enzyme [Mycolicibacterium baixiangningiae]|uniref:aminotransferase class I/II-fold pyridoxal phosphate-dependent enzyme n=1 Tax=Mycolicibacterium baixiangningiae TaxID=2761578 RepID=UPI001867DD64|nr:aminotransferase class I/II-fold pyridoxal phosphate-dependent enzyme [Mycolicibacterium baixiangningiae]